MKRLFIAINLPEDIKVKIEADLRGFSQSLEGDLHGKFQIRWLPAENWHLTIIFLGYQPDEAISPILNSIKETLNKYSNILQNVRISFDEIILAPPGKPPRMIWLTGTKETSEILGQLKNDLENNLIKNSARFKRENRGYNAHITLARFRPLTRITADNKLITADNLKSAAISQNQRKSVLGFQPQSLDLMESHLKRTGAEYEILQSIDFVNQ